MALTIVPRYPGMKKKHVYLQFHERTSWEFNYPGVSVTNCGAWRDRQERCAVCSQWALFPRLMGCVSSWTFYIKLQHGNLMLSEDGPSRAPLKSRPEPSTKANLDRRSPSVNRCAEMIYFFQADRQMCDGSARRC